MSVEANQLASTSANDPSDYFGDRAHSPPRGRCKRTPSPFLSELMHISVLPKQVLEYLDPKPNENYIDGTLGFAGHSKLILERIKPNGRVLGIELTSEVFEQIKKQNIERLVLENNSYSRLQEIIKKHNFLPVHGILLDLGMSSWHLEGSGKGFSFQKNEELDMRFNQDRGVSAKDIVNLWPRQELEEMLIEYGGERFAKRISDEIVQTRKDKPIKTTSDLIVVLERAIPKRFQQGKIHFATKTFQALRIKANHELENIKQVLPQALKILEKGGRIAIISFHSGEDRIVKNFFRDHAKLGHLKTLTKKPIIAQEDEIKDNPRSRSAKLRVAEKL